MLNKGVEVKRGKNIRNNRQTIGEREEKNKKEVKKEIRSVRTNTLKKRTM
jgi:hypothetical protein